MKSILIVDDDAEIRELLRIFLDRAGYQTFLAEDGVQGMEIMQSESIQLVITDLLMPEQEGIETILKLKELFPHVPVLAMSGGGRVNASLDILHSAKLLGAQKTFTKPFDTMEVVNTIRELIGRPQF